MASVSNIPAGENSSEQEQIRLNYENAKQYYLEKIGNPFLLGIPLFTKQAIEHFIEQLINKTISSNRFTVGVRDGETKLLLKNQVPFPEVLSYEDAFDVVIKKHLECNHGDAKKTFELLKKEYSVPIFCLRLAVESCNLCRATAQTESKINEIKQPKEEGNGVWRLNIIPTRHYSGGDTYKNRNIMLYKHNETNFVLLRALFDKAEELGLELMKIFLEFGTPNKVVVPDNLEFYKLIFQRLYRIRSEVQVSVELGDMAIFNTDKSEMMKELDIWSQETNSTYWDVGCHIVQYKLNTSRRFINKYGSNETYTGIPFNLFFGQEANVSSEVYKDLT